MTDTDNLSWLLDSELANVPDFHAAVVLSRDGLVLEHSSDTNRDRADTLAALASGLRSLSIAASTDDDGGAVKSTVVEMEHGFLFICAAGPNASLAVRTGAGTDPQAVAAAIHRFITRVGPHLKTSYRRPQSVFGDG